MTTAQQWSTDYFTTSGGMLIAISAYLNNIYIHDCKTVPLEQA